jgi:hypothetical protein
MIQFKIKVDQALTKALNDLPLQVQFKCIDPAARKMAHPIVRASKINPPSSRSLSGTQRWSSDTTVSPRSKWSRSARAKYEKDDSGQHVISKYWKHSRGGILYIGMQATEAGMGRKMHFRLPVTKGERKLYYWGRPGQIITQRAGKRTITYTRGQNTQAEDREGRYMRPGSSVPLERKHFLKRAYERSYNQALGIFKNEFYKQAKGLTLG